MVLVSLTAEEHGHALKGMGMHCTCSAGMQETAWLCKTCQTSWWCAGRSHGWLDSLRGWSTVPCRLPTSDLAFLPHFWQVGTLPRVSSCAHLQDLLSRSAAVRHMSCMVRAGGCRPEGQHCSLRAPAAAVPTLTPQTGLEQGALDSTCWVVKGS